MKYLLLVYRDEQEGETGPAGESDAFSRDCRAKEEALLVSGYLLGAVHLQSDSPATTLRVQNGDLSFTDGSPSGMKEKLTAVYIISARDLNEAVRVAARMPRAQGGPIEIRSIDAGGPLF